MTAQEPFLRIAALSKSFGGLSVISGLDLDVNKGEILGILGPNGAGKSTLFNLITGVLLSSSGAVHFSGNDITQMKAWDRCRAGIGRTYQIPKPFSHMSTYENVLVAAMHGSASPLPAAQKKAAEILNRTGLMTHAGKAAGSLRLLDLKRLELARALATDPELLLLDEIAGGLTEEECSALVELILGIREEGRTIVWVEHVITALRRASTRIAVVYGGKILRIGAPSDVLASADVRSVYLGEEDAK
jgi:branched-chain amino acid transport system ATP-binding protein